MDRFGLFAHCTHYGLPLCKGREPCEGSRSKVLALASEQDRILVSHDVQTMPRHFGDFLQTRGSSPGVILVPRSMPIGRASEELVLVWGASDAGEWKNRIFRIPLRTP